MSCMGNFHGFTLIELIVVVALVAIGATIAVPSLQSLIRNNRVTAQTNEFIGALSFARSEAVKRGAYVVTCPANDTTGCVNTAWETGWLIFADPDNSGTYSKTTNDAILKFFPALTSGSTLVGTSPLVSFGGNGFLNPKFNDDPLKFSLSAEGCTGTEKRNITISRQGHPSVARASC